MKTLCFMVFAFAAGLLTAPSARANNNLFLPGDAFFPTVLTRDDVATLQATPAEERTFSYSSFGGYEGAFCGYAGYANAKISAVDDAFVAHLKTAYERVRETNAPKLVERMRNGRTQLIETNGVRVLFYPSDFQFPRFHLGLRYNENWVAETMKFGHKREHLRLCCLIPSAEAVEQEWRDADLVSPLRVKLPDVKLAPNPATDEAVTIQGEVKAIVIGSHSLLELFDPAGDDDLTIYVVTSDAITQLVRRDGAWRRAE